MAESGQESSWKLFSNYHKLRYKGRCIYNLPSSNDTNKYIKNRNKSNHKVRKVRTKKREGVDSLFKANETEA